MGNERGRQWVKGQRAAQGNFYCNSIQTNGQRKECTQTHTHTHTKSGMWGTHYLFLIWKIISGTNSKNVFLNHEVYKKSINK